MGVLIPQNRELLDIALSQYGIQEWRGQKHNPEVLKYFRELGFNQQWITDETAWCSAFMNWCAYKCGLDHTRKLNARSWLNVGLEVVSPEPGDVVIFWREAPESWKGHVGVYIAQRNGNIYTLGGNQSNMVNIAPYRESRLLGFRRLKRV